MNLTAEDVRGKLDRLGLSPGEAARKFGVAERTVYRWLEAGCTGTSAAALVLAERLSLPEAS